MQNIICRESQALCKINFIKTSFLVATVPISPSFWRLIYIFSQKCQIFKNIGSKFFFYCIAIFMVHWQHNKHIASKNSKYLFHQKRDEGAPIRLGLIKKGANLALK